MIGFAFIRICVMLFLLNLMLLTFILISKCLSLCKKMASEKSKAKRYMRFQSLQDVAPEERKLNRKNNSQMELKWVDAETK